MLVVPYVCAEFHDKSGNVIHRIHAHELRTITELNVSIGGKIRVICPPLRKDRIKQEIRAEQNPP